MGWWGNVRRVERLEEQLEELRREFKRIDLEWTDTYDKFRTMVAKWAKRIERAQNAAEDSEAEPVVPDGHTALTAKQQQINASILARRARR